MIPIHLPPAPICLPHTVRWKTFHDTLPTTTTYPLAPICLPTYTDKMGNTPWYLPTCSHLQPPPTHLLPSATTAYTSAFPHYPYAPICIPACPLLPPPPAPPPNAYPLAPICLPTYTVNIKYVSYTRVGSINICNIFLLQDVIFYMCMYYIHIYIYIYVCVYVCVYASVCAMHYSSLMVTNYDVSMLIHIHTRADIACPDTQRTHTHRHTHTHGYTNSPVCIL